MTRDDKSSKKPCPLCGGTFSTVIYELIDIPCSCNILWKSKEEATNCPKGDIVLAFCPSCTYIANYALEPEKNRYDARYDNSLFYSPLFKRYVEKTVAELIQRFNLHQKTVMEITVGKVDFLSFFCSLGPNDGISFNPTLVDDPHSVEKTLENIPSNVDFVFSFHELEHANYPCNLLNLLKKVVKENPSTIFYFSVPNIYNAFNEGDFTDVMYEHVSYFTLPSLLYMFTICGYKILNVHMDNEGLYNPLIIVASISAKADSSHKTALKSDSEEIKALTLRYASKAKTVIDEVTLQLKSLLDQGKKIVVWGAGARGVTLLNILKDNRLQYVIDINPNKQGKYIPGTAQEIKAPDFLKFYQPDYVFIVNSIYKAEIEKKLAELKLKSQVLTLKH